MIYLEIKKNNQSTVQAGGREISMLNLSIVGSAHSPIVSVSATGINDTAGEKDQHPCWLSTTLQADEWIEFIPRKRPYTVDESVNNTNMTKLDSTIDHDSVEETIEREPPSQSALSFVITLPSEKPVVACIGEQEQLQVICTWLKDQSRFRLIAENATVTANGTTDGQMLYERQLNWDQPVQLKVHFKIKGAGVI